MDRFFGFFFAVLFLVYFTPPMAPKAQEELTYEKNEAIHAADPYRFGFEGNGQNLFRVAAGTQTNLKFSVVLVNKGTQPDSYTVSAKPDGIATAWQASVEPAIGPLQPGEKGTIHVMVAIPASAQAGTQGGYTVEVTDIAGHGDGMGYFIDIVAYP